MTQAPTKRQTQRKLQMAFFTNMLKFASVFAKRSALTPISDFILWLLAKLTIRIKGAEHRESVEEIGKEWQKMFPSRAFVPIKEVSGDTVYAEILGACPVAGTGDVHACYRLMEYDRQLLKHIGGEFVVLESKADPSIHVCRVAMRVKGANVNDLTPAHEKVMAG